MRVFKVCFHSAVLGAVVVIGSVLFPLESHGQGKYTIVPIPPLAGKTMYPAVINDSGHIAGSTWDLASVRAFVYRNGVVTEPGTFGGSRSTASAINNRGEVVGYAYNGDELSRGFLLKDGVMTDLGALGTGRESIASAINDSGVIVGATSIVDTQWLDEWGGHAFIREGGAKTLIGSLGGRSGAFAINNNGVVVGSSYLADALTVHAFRYENGVMIDLGTLGTDPLIHSTATVVNDDGLIAGQSQVAAGGGSHPFIYENGTMTDLGFGGSVSGMNNAGHIVGLHIEGYPYLYVDGQVIDLNTLIDPASGWTVSRADDINNRGQIVGMGYLNGEYRGILMTPPELTVTRPLQGERWVVGEPDTIRWHSPTPRLYRIYYSLDDGATYTEIAEVGENDSLYVWHPPDDVRSSSECRIKLKAILEPDSAESDRFILRAVDLVRELTDGSLDPFYPSDHAWQFANTDPNTMWPESWWDQFDYRNGFDFDRPGEYPNDASLAFRFEERSSFPDWPLFVQVAGRENCYVETLFGLGEDDYNERMVRNWAIYATPWSGSCYGLSLTALLEFSHRAQIGAEFSAMAGLTSIAGTAVNNDIRRIINQFQNYPVTPLLSNYRILKERQSPRQTLAEIRAWLLTESRDDDAALIIDGQTRSGSHCVLPYIVERYPGDPGKFRVYLYDPNQPLNNSAMIEIDSAANTWTDMTPLGYGSGSTGCYPTLPARMHLRGPAAKNNPPLTARAGAARPGVSLATTVLVSPGSDIVIVDGSGDTVGYRDSVAVRGIAGASVFIRPTGGYSAPEEYTLPTGSYAVMLDRFTDTTVMLAMERDSVYYSLRRSAAANGQRDILTIGDGVAFINPDTAEKSVDWKIVLTGDSSQRTFDVTNLLQQGGDSIRLAGGNGSIVVGSGIAGTTYDLGIKHSSPGGTSIFFRQGIILPPGATHTVTPADDSLSAIVLLVDEDSDGITDDSLALDNELTGVEVAAGTGLPAGFALLRNYPNPFNPSTTIAYTIPERTYVTLKVYDVLGRQVATLVDGVEGPGSRQTEWMADDLPGGVYYYRITAGEFSDTGTMVLIK